MIEDEYPPDEWNIYPFHFSDGDNWSVDDTVTCVDILRSKILPAVNLFCYGQVESPYGSGEYIRSLEHGFEEHESKLIAAEIENKEAIYACLKKFLGTGV
jgi:uncharacterized sporulation protein YeaH/YhbH (DUF444 family)